jgi:hypothetical protein
MASSQPYDIVRRENGSTVFSGDLPAFAPIGRHYDELYETYFHFKYPRDYLKNELAFVRAIEEAGDRAVRQGGDWTAINQDLESRFGDKFRRLRSSIPPNFVDAARHSSQAVSQILQMVVVQARVELARKASESDTAGDSELQAAASWQPPAPTDLLKSPQFLGQMDQWKSMDPGAGDRIAGIMRGLSMFQVQSPASYGPEQQVDAIVKTLTSSPQVKGILDFGLKAIERYKQSNPELARAMQAQVDEMKAIDEMQRAAAADPARFRAEEMARMQAAAAAEPAVSDESAQKAKEGLKPGAFRFDCSSVKVPTENQKRLFTWLVEHQNDLKPKVEKTLRAMHAEVADQSQRDDPKERVIFPKNAADSDIPLNFFRIESIILPESGDRIGMAFDSIWGHEEHGCALVIDGGEVIEFGGTEVLAALESNDDDDDGYENDDGEN